MKLTTTARHFEASPELLEHTEKRLGRLKRFFDQILHVDVIMSVEKVRNIAEINVHVNGHDFTAQEESKDMKLSVDKAAKSLERQMKKFKGKIISNHHKPARRSCRCSRRDRDRFGQHRRNRRTADHRTCPPGRAHLHGGGGDHTVGGRREAFYSFQRQGNG